MDGRDVVEAELHSRGGGVGGEPAEVRGPAEEEAAAARGRREGRAEELRG